MPPKFAFLILVLLLLSSSEAAAEKICFKDGRILKAPIAYRSKGSIWVKHPPGALGISRKEIDRIENDDGSISKYDYENINKKTQEAIRQKKYAEASRLCGLFLETFPSDIDTRYLRAILNQKTGELAKSVDDYRFLIENNTATANVYNNLGTIYAGEGRNMEAVEMFLAAVKKSPVMANAYYNLGISYSRMGEEAKAKDAFKKSISLDPKNLDAKKALEKLASKSIKSP